MSKPNLGTTWKEAIESAYAYGYECWEYSFAEIKDIAQQEAEENGERMAVDMLMNEYDYITHGEDSRKLWWAIDEFYENYMPQEDYEQLQREAAVAEDLDSAYEAGCYDAILGREYNPEKVSHFYE